MEIKVSKSKTYRVEEDTIKKFKEKMLEYYNDLKEISDSSEEPALTVDDIPDTVITEVLAEAINELEDMDCYYSCLIIDNYFNTVSIDFTEDDITDYLYEAVYKWKGV